MGKSDNAREPKDEIHKHIVVTEAVHCKSKSEYGVKECACLCVRKWLDKVLSEYNGKYIVVVGSTAKACMFAREIQGKKIAFIPAPNARGYTDEQRRKILLDQFG